MALPKVIGIFHIFSPTVIYNKKESSTLSLDGFSKSNTEFIIGNIYRENLSLSVKTAIDFA